MLPPNPNARHKSNARTPLVARLVIAIVIGTGALYVGARPAAQSLPAGWADQDIGAVGLAGSATFDGTTFTLRGAGADIWGTADAFDFANQSLVGDGQIIAHVKSMQNTNVYAKAGVMIRETLTASSAHVILDVKPGGGVEFMTRTTTGGSTSFVAGGTGSWLKLVRSSGVFTAYASNDGITWMPVGSKAVSMGSNTWVGLAVCSHDAAALNTSVFDHVSVASATDAAPTVSITSPSNGASFSAGANLSISANASDGDATPVARVDFYANNGTSNALIGSDTSSPYAITWSNVAAGSYSLTAVATDTANRSTTSAVASISVAAGGGGGTLPAGWADQDIGVVGLAGSAGFSSGTFTVKGAGADIWGTADAFNFANLALVGDGQIIAHVASTTNTNAHAKAGVMIREALTASSRHVILDMQPGGGVEFMTRATSGGSTSFLAGGTGTWLKLVRSNGVFTASVSSNGSTWTVVGSTALSMAGNVWAGLAVCSHNTSALNTSLFDNVMIGPVTGGGTDAPPSVSITGPTSGAQFSAGSNITVSASASDGDATPVSKVDFYANNQLIGTDTSSPYSITWSNVAAGSYSLTAAATDTANQSTASSAVSVTVSSGGGGGGALPSGWTDQDVGAVGLAGSASGSNGTFTVKGGGADIWGNADAFNFASRALGGAGEIVAHVASMTNTNAYAKAGVMIRDSTSAGSAHVTLDVKPNGTVEFLARATAGGSTAFLGGGTGTWVKLVRSSNNGFTAYVSGDGATWQLIGSTIVAMPSSTVRMGLAVCSHNVGALNTALFDNVADTGPTTAPAAPVITSPPDGSTFPVGSSPIFTATAAQGVNGFNLYVNDGTKTVSSCEFIDPTGSGSFTCINYLYHLAAGTYTVTASVLYNSGSRSTSSPITIHISNTPGADIPPSVTITSPASGSVLPAGSPVTITASATDPDSTKIARVDYWLEEYGSGYYYNYGRYWSYIGQATASPYAVTWTHGATTANIVAVVTDSAGLATASYVSVTVR